MKIKNSIFAEKRGKAYGLAGKRFSTNCGHVCVIWKFYGEKRPKKSAFALYISAPLGKQYLRTQKQEDAICEMFDIFAWR